MKVLKSKIYGKYRNRRNNSDIHDLVGGSSRATADNSQTRTTGKKVAEVKQEFNIINGGDSLGTKSK